MRTNHRRGIAYGLTAGALAAALALAGCSGASQSGSANGTATQNSSAASNVETSNVAIENENANSNAEASGNQSENSSVASNASNADASTSENANSNAATTAANNDAEDAKGTLPDGWYLTSLTGTDGTSNISAASVSDGTWTITGTLTRAESEDALYGDANQGEFGPGTWNLKVSKDAIFEAGSNPKAADRSAVESTITSLNGLGLVLHVEDGQVTYARLAS